MVLTAQRAYANIRHTLGGALSTELAAQDIANAAGQFLVNVRRWNWLRRQLGHLNLRANISLTGCTWTEATKTITKASGFTDYALLRGDNAEIVSGTGATPGFYPIASRTSANAIVLDGSIGSAADGQTNIAVKIDCSAIALPSDFRDLIAVELDGQQSPGIALTTSDELLMYKARGVLPPTPNACTWVAIAYGLPPSSGGAPTPRLESYPGFSANDTAGMKIAYRAGWKAITNDSDLVSVPDWLEEPYLDMVRTYARSYEEEDVAPRTARLATVLQSPDYLAAVQRDSEVQSSFGPLKGGWMPEGEAYFTESPYTVTGP